MPDLYGSLRLRPTRIGFLVRPTDKANIRRIMRLNTCLWGGGYNPIIPVCRTVPIIWQRKGLDRISGPELTDGYLEFFQPDVYVEATPGLGKKCGIGGDSDYSFEKRLVTLDNFVMRSDGRSPTFHFGLSMIDAYRDLFKEEFQFVAEHDRRVLLCDGAGRDGAFFEVATGCFPEDADLHFYRSSYIDAFKADVVEPDPSHMISLLEGRVNTPLGFTKYRTEKLVHERWEPRVFVFDPSSPLDLIDMWNIRQVHRDVFPINVHWLRECGEFLSTFVARNHLPIPGNRDGLMTHTTIEIARSINAEAIKEELQGLLSDLPNRSWVLREWYDAIWRKPSSRIMPQVRRADIESEEIDLELDVEEEDEPTVRFSSLSPDFADRYGGHSSRWVNVLSIQNYGNAGNWAFTLPSTTKTSAYPGHHVSDAILVTREGLVIRQRFKRSREYIRLVPGKDAIINWLKDQSIDAEPSDSGRTADQVIRAVEGFWGAYILSHEDTLRLLDKMAKRENVKARADGQTIEQYPGRTASIEDWKRIVGLREAALYRHESLLDRFVKAGALKLGLQIDCDNCEKKNWYSITSMSDKLTCERCLTKFDFPQGTLDYKNTPWRFRVAGPFAVPNYAGGAYATVLTLRCLTAALGSGHQSITYSTSLDLSFKGRSIEIDFACWYRRDRWHDRTDEPVFVIGEAKSFGREVIKEKDVLRMKTVAREVPGSIIVFAVLKKSLSSQEKSRLKELALWGRESLPDGRRRAPVVILTGTELFADHHVELAWKDAGGIRAEIIQKGHTDFDDLVALSDATQQAYLGMPGYWEWFDKKYRKKRKRKKRSRKQVTTKATKTTSSGSS